MLAELGLNIFCEQMDTALLKEDDACACPEEDLTGIPLLFSGITEADAEVS